MNIGVLSLQGAFLKHMHLLKKIGVNPVSVRYKDDLLNLHGLIIPGGESTVLSKLIMKQSLYEPLEKFISKYPVYGTCAGLILLSKIIEKNKIVKSFEKLDITIKRNAWGRQINSFISNLKIKEFDSTFKGIFIRAPKINKVSSSVDILSSINNSPVMVRQDNLLGTTFHPELSNDVRIHKYFIGMIESC